MHVLKLSFVFWLINSILELGGAQFNALDFDAYNLRSARDRINSTHWKHRDKVIVLKLMCPSIFYWDDTSLRTRWWYLCFGTCDPSIVRGHGLCTVRHHIHNNFLNPQTLTRKTYLPPPPPPPLPVVTWHSHQEPATRYMRWRIIVVAKRMWPGTPKPQPYHWYLELTAPGSRRPTCLAVASRRAFFVLWYFEKCGHFAHTSPFGTTQASYALFISPRPEGSLPCAVRRSTQ